MPSRADDGLNDVKIGDNYYCSRCYFGVLVLAIINVEVTHDSTTRKNFIYHLYLLRSNLYVERPNFFWIKKYQFFFFYNYPFFLKLLIFYN